MEFDSQIERRDVTEIEKRRNADRSNVRGSDAILVASEIGRSFGQTVALRSCSITLLPGEVHALVGENGSGKSTFVKVLSGVLAPDSGSLAVGSWQGSHIPSPRVARDLGIATVFQEILTLDAMSVLDNIWLGGDGEFRRRLADAEKRARAAEVLARLVDVPPPLDVPVERLDLASRQICVIARALVQDSNILILDESTSALDHATRSRLFESVTRVCAGGTSVLFISHRMDEIAELGDRVTVLRSGSSVATLERADSSTQRLLEIMSGEAHRTQQRRARASTGKRKVALAARNVRLHPRAKPLDAVVEVGEILGVAGLEGHGQDTFVRALVGLDRVAAGTIVRVDDDGRERTIVSRHDASAGRMAYVARDRKTEGIFESLSILTNFSLPTILRDGKFFVHERRRRRRLASYIERLGIKLAAAGDRITTLSGGNQQKVVLARWLATEPRVIVLNDPTRGVDLRTKSDLYELLTELAASGVAIVLLSTEVEELLALTDRVLVFRDDSITAELQRHEITRSALIAAYFGELVSGGQAPKAGTS